MNIIEYFKHTFSLFLTLVFATLMLTACGGGGGGGGGGSDDGGGGGGNGGGGGTVGGIAGSWTITETAKDHDCGEELALETFALTIERTGNLVTITDEDGDSFSAPLFGKKFIWSDSFAEAAPDDTPGTMTVNPLSVTIDDSCNALSGTANWRWEADDGSFACSGITTFTGSRSPADGCGDFSDEYVDITAPDTPTGFYISTSSITASKLALYWNGPDAEDEDTAGYKLYRDDGYLATISVDEAYGDSGGIFVRYEDSNLDTATEYCYAISAFDMAGNESVTTDTLCATTLSDTSDTVPPSAPANLRATAMSANRIDLSWDASTDNVAVSLYNVYRVGRPTPIAVWLSTITTHSDTDGLIANTNYCYTVTAMDPTRNESLASNQACATTRDTIPATPSNTNATVTGNILSGYSINLTWQDNSDNETRFEIGVCVGTMSVTDCMISTNKIIIQLVPNLTSASYDAGLITGPYTFFVRACNEAGCSGSVGGNVTIP